MYDFTDKFALVTGGGQGIGLAYIRELLINGVGGVSLVDIDVEQGEKSVKELNEEFGKNKVLFVCADVTNSNEFEDAFKTSISHWRVLDIVINNVGICSENKWELEISVNCGGAVQGTLLAFKYLSKNDGGRGGIVINTASINGIDPMCSVPIYSATKAFVIALGRAFGTQPYFIHNGVQVITICPGSTDTQMARNCLNSISVSICPNLKEVIVKESDKFICQTTEEVAKGMISVIKKANNGSVWVIEGNEGAYEIAYTERTAMRVT